MIYLIAGALIALISLLIGFNLGKFQAPFSPQIKKKLDEAFSRVVPSSDVGAVERPTPRQVYFRDHPEEAKEQQIMSEKFKEEINK